jgi:uncharacterized protein
MVKFLCDEMLAGLGRWLRIAGYDTAIAGGGLPDRDIAARASAERRILLTRDRRFAEYDRAEGRVLRLSHDDLETCARELTERIGVDWHHRPFTRCVACNAPLEPATADDIARLAPPRLPKTGTHRCPRCAKLYWEGSHVRRMRRRLETLASAGRRSRNGPAREGTGDR